MTFRKVTTLILKEKYEDIHMNIEALLGSNKIGSLSGKLHTARSTE